MKKSILFAAAACMIAFASCSKTEGENAANDESVVGATDGVEVIEESAGEVEGVETVPTEVEATAETDAPEVSEGTEAEKKNLIDKAKETYEKGKDVVNEGVEKSKEVYEKSKDAVKEGVEKGKELINNLKK